MGFGLQLLTGLQTVKSSCSYCDSLHVTWWVGLDWTSHTNRLPKLSLYMGSGKGHLKMAPSSSVFRHHGVFLKEIARGRFVLLATNCQLNKFVKREAGMGRHETWNLDFVADFIICLKKSLLKENELKRALRPSFQAAARSTVPNCPFERWKKQITRVKKLVQSESQIIDWERTRFSNGTCQHVKKKPRCWTRSIDKMDKTQCSWVETQETAPVCQRVSTF